MNGMVGQASQLADRSSSLLQISGAECIAAGSQCRNNQMSAHLEFQQKFKIFVMPSMANSLIPIGKTFQNCQKFLFPD
jgi:hypothetical protein